jgi:hypothetical protein
MLRWDSDWAGIQQGDYTNYGNLNGDLINQSEQFRSIDSLYLRVRYDADGGTQSAGLFTFDYSLDGLGWVTNRGGSEAERSIGDGASAMTIDGVYEIGLFVKTEANDARDIFSFFRTSTDVSDMAVMRGDRVAQQRD